MKKYLLLLFILLLTANQPLVTQNPVNVSPTSIENIKKPAKENQTTKKSNPSTHFKPNKYKKFNPKILKIKQISLALILKISAAFYGRKTAGLLVKNTDTRIFIGISFFGAPDVYRKIWNLVSDKYQTKTERGLAIIASILGFSNGLE